MGAMSVIGKPNNKTRYSRHAKNRMSKVIGWFMLIPIRHSDKGMYAMQAGGHTVVRELTQ